VHVPAMTGDPAISPLGTKRAAHVFMH